LSIISNHTQFPEIQTPLKSLDRTPEFQPDQRLLNGGEGRERGEKDEGIVSLV